MNILLSDAFFYNWLVLSIALALMLSSIRKRWLDCLWLSLPSSIFFAVLSSEQSNHLQGLMSFDWAVVIPFGVSLIGANWFLSSQLDDRIPHRNGPRGSTNDMLSITIIFIPYVGSFIAFIVAQVFFLRPQWLLNVPQQQHHTFELTTSLRKVLEQPRKLKHSSVFWVIGIVLIASSVVAVRYFTMPTTKMTVEDLSTRFELLAFHSPNDFRGSDNTASIITKWNHDLIIGLSEENELLATDLRDQFGKFSWATGLKIVVVDDFASHRDVAVTFEKGGGLSTKGEAFLFTYKYKSVMDPNGHGLSGVNIQFDMNAITQHLSPDDSDWDPRRLAITSSFISFGMFGTYEFDTPRYQHPGGGRIRVPLALAAMYYDPRIKHGMTKAEVMPVAHVIAEEIVAADSFEDWLQQREAR